MISTSIRLPVELLEWSKSEAARRNLPSWSALVRQLLENERTELQADTAMVPLAEVRRLLASLASRNPAA